MSKKTFFVYLFTFFLLTLIPFSVDAAEFRSGETILVGEKEVVANDLYLSAAEITFNGQLDGDLFVVGGVVNINGTINGDANIVGGDVVINGEIGEDLRVVSGTLKLNNQIGGDLLVGAGDVAISSDGVIENKSNIGAGSLTIAGTTQTIEAGVGRIEINSGANINGDLNYYSERTGEISQDANIEGDVNFNKVKGTYGFTESASAKAASLLGALLVGLLAVYYLPNFSLETAREWRNNAGANLLWGFLALIAIPAASMILMVSLVGFPLGLGLLIVYPILLYLSMIVAVIGLGFCVENYFGKKKKQPDWLTLVIGLLIFYLVGLIPVIGDLTTFIITLIGLGSFLVWKKTLIAKLKKDKAI